VGLISKEKMRRLKPFLFLIPGITLMPVAEKVVNGNVKIGVLILSLILITTSIVIFGRQLFRGGEGTGNDVLKKKFKGKLHPNNYKDEEENSREKV
jgi:hypothetical protein